MHEDRGRPLPCNGIRRHPVAGIIQDISLRVGSIVMPACDDGVTTQHVVPAGFGRNDDIYFSKGGNSKQAFFTSRRNGGFGDADIYSVDFNESSRMIVYLNFKYDEIGAKENLLSISAQLAA